MAENIDIVVTDDPGEDVLAQISGALDEFNIAATGIADRKPLAVLAIDPETGQVQGGVTGRTSLGMLFIDLFYLPAHLRGSGLGSRMLAAMEAEGRRRGCCSAVLYTITFQAPEFYRRHGWVVFGAVPCYPEGTARVFLRKDL